MTIFGILEIIATVFFPIIEIFILFFAIVGAHEVVKEWRDKRKENKKWK